MRISDNSTFESLAQKYRQALTRAAYHLCGDLEAACDVVQDTLADAFRGFAGLRDHEKAGAWFFAILRRKAIAYRQSRRPSEEFMEEHFVSDDGTESLIRGIVIDQMKKLPAEDRELLAGKYLLGLSYKELADSLGVKEGTVRVRCLRAKERLREILKGSGMKVPERR